MWLAPAVATLLLWGLGQGLLKQFIGDVRPARFCLYYVLARGLVNIGFYLATAAEGTQAPNVLTSFFATGVLAYLFDGVGWILYFESIVAGPITIIGTLSAAYPALTILLAHLFLGEKLVSRQYEAAALVVLGCVGLALPTQASQFRIKANRWVPFALGAILCWASSQLCIKYAFTLPGAEERGLALCSLIGSAVTLGAYGLVRGRTGEHSWGGWLRSFLPMGMMAGGDLGLILANRNGPVSIIAPLTAAYPAVTMAYAILALRERLSPTKWFMLGGTLAGILLLSG